MISFLGLIFPAILKFLKVFGIGALEKWLDYLKATRSLSTAKEIAIIDLMIAQVETAIQEGNARAAYLDRLMDTWWFQVIVAVVFASIGIYTTMVFVDSFVQEWIEWDYNVQKVPPPFDTLLLWFWSLITLKFTFFRK